MSWEALKTALEAGNDAKLKGSFEAGADAIVVSGSPTLDLNGQTITCPDTRLTNALFVVTNGKKLTVNNSKNAGVGTIRGPNGTIVSDGGVFAVTNADLVINGGNFTNFTVAANGGVVSANLSTLVFAGGVFTGCRAGTAGGAVFVMNSDLTVRGGVFAANSAGTAGTADFSVDNIDPGEAGGVSGGVFGDWPAAFDDLLDAEFAKADVGAMSVVGKNVVAFADRIQLGAFTFDPSGLPYSLYVSLADGSTSVRSGEYWVVSDGTVPCVSWDELKTALESGVGASLAASFEMTSSGTIQPPTGAVVLNLNGHTISRNSGVCNAEPMFRLADRARLTVADTVGTGGMTGDSQAPVETAGGAFVVAASGELTIDGGTYRNFSTALSGGVIDICDGGQVVVSGGTFEDCSAERYGGVASVTGEGSSLQITDGAFRRNHCDVSTETKPGGIGGVVFVEDKAALAVTGGLFTGNSAFDDSSADFGSQEGSVTIGGGVFDFVNGLAQFVLPDGVRRGAAGEFCVLGKGVLSNRAYIRAGTFAFDLTAEPYAGCNLIDPAVTTVVKDGETWRVTSTVDDGRAACFTWNEIKSGLEEGMDVVLVTNITINAGARVSLEAGQQVTLDMNGCTLMRTEGGDSDKTPFHVYQSASLTVVSTNGMGFFQGPHSGCVLKSSLFWVSEGGALEIRNCRISNFRSQSSPSVVHSYCGDVTIVGCEISDCEREEGGDGGAIFLRGELPFDGTLTMTSNVIWNCSAKRYGGGAVGAELAERVTIQDVTFSNCTARLDGGAVDVYKCSSATFAGAACCGNGVSDQDADNTGSVLYVDACDATVASGRFEDNGTVGFDLGCGKSGNIIVRGGVFRNWNPSDDRVRVDSGFECKKSGSYFVVGKDLVVEDGVVRTGLFAFNPKDEAYSGCDFLNNNAQVEKEGEFWRVVDSALACTDWSELKRLLEAGKAVCLGGDVSSSGSTESIVISGQAASLDLAGHTLTLASDVQIRVLDGGSLKVSTSATGGVISGTDSEQFEGVLQADNSSLTLDGVTIRDFTVSVDPGKSGYGIIRAMNGGTVTMNGGTVTNCCVTPQSDDSVVYGSVVSVTNGTFVMTGGQITDCGSLDANVLGGAVYARESTVTLTGGKICRCKAVYGGAVYLDYSYSEEIADFEFRDNMVSASGCGGAIYARSASYVLINSCIALGNKSSIGPDHFFCNVGRKYNFHGAVIEDPSYREQSCYLVTSVCSSVCPGAVTYLVFGHSIWLAPDKKTIIMGAFTFNPLAEPYAETGICDPNEVFVEEHETEPIWKWEVKTLDEKQTNQITKDTQAGTKLSTGIYEVNENVTLVNSNGCGLEVEKNSIVAIYIARNCTLTVTGSNGSGATAGCAGFQVADGSELIIVGDGTLKATGGNSGQAAGGENGGDGSLESDPGYDRLYGGKGGNGGSGAGGAGAGIGTSGGYGGSGGIGLRVSSYTGNAKDPSDDERTPRKSGGYSNGPGSGGNGGKAGVVNFLGNVMVFAAGGACNASGGAGGGSGNDFAKHRDYSRGRDIAAGGGGGGGGGGFVSADAPGIGGGVGGGGGGGAGGGGGLDADLYGQAVGPAHGGGGAGGANEGIDGSGDVTTSPNGYSGAAGQSGAGAGGNGAANDIYVSQTAELDGASATGNRETHSFLKRSVTFDFQGGLVHGEGSAVRDVYLYLTLPDAPLPDREATGTSEGWIFEGYFTLKDGYGVMYYDRTGEPQITHWTRQDENMTLYAYWRKIVPPADPLVVTRLDDEEFDPDDPAITFRAAVSWAMLFPKLLEGQDGTLSKITFAESLFSESDAVSIALNGGRIRVSEERFTDHPLVIQGPTNGIQRVTLDASAGSGSILDIAVRNELTVRDLTFVGGSAETTGGAINMKGGRLTVSACTFSGNSSVGDGGAIYLGRDSATDGCVMTNVVFTSNSSGNRGGAIGCCTELDVASARFESNRAGADGGAIFGATGSRMSVRQATFRENTGANGGAWASGGNLFALNCTVILNTAKAFGGGYALLKGAGSAAGVAGHPGNQFANCTFRNNSAKNGGGISVAEEGGLSLVNVLVMQNAVTGGSTALSDLYVSPNSGAVVNTKGVVAGGTNLTGGEKCTFDSSLRANRVFASVTPGQSKVLVGEIEQNLERLSLLAGNPATDGYDASVWRTDITGRSFETCQIGSCWLLSEKPSLVVTTLSDIEDKQDGYTSLREIETGINGKSAEWKALMSNGVYRITFQAGLSGTLELLHPHFTFRDPYGGAVEIDGGAAAGGAVEIAGDVIDNNEYRAFFVPAGTTLRLKNLNFLGCLGRSAVGSAESQTHDGGAIVNLGNLSAEACVFSACSAGDTFLNPVGYGGGIVNGLSGKRGALLGITNCVFRLCRAAKGGGLYNWSGNTADILNSRFVANSVGDSTSVKVAAGGAIFNEADADLSYSGTTFERNTAIVDGKTQPSDVGGKDITQPYYKVAVKGGVTTVSLSPEYAAPDVVADGEEGGLAVSEDGVSLMPGNVLPNLYYGLGHSDTPEGEYVVEEDGWVRADADGRLPAALVAPKSGSSGYYRVFVKE